MDGERDGPGDGCVMTGSEWPVPESKPWGVSARCTILLRLSVIRFGREAINVDVAEVVTDNIRHGLPGNQVLPRVKAVLWK